MKYLIGDIGNTSTKLCILNKEFKIFRSYEFQTEKIYKGSFIKKFLSSKLTKDLNINSSNTFKENSENKNIEENITVEKVPSE